MMGRAVRVEADSDAHRPGMIFSSVGALLVYYLAIGTIRNARRA